MVGGGGGEVLGVLGWIGGFTVLCEVNRVFVYIDAGRGGGALVYCMPNLMSIVSFLKRIMSFV